MKKIKHGFLKKYNHLISILLAFLGFATACEPGADEYGVPITEYGAPYATFVIKGGVKSENTNNSISNIRVVMYNDTAITNVDGNYQFEFGDYPGDKAYPLEFIDIDGDANGSYQSLDTIAEFKDAQYTGGDGHWYVGKAETELNVKLKSKE